MKSDKSKSQVKREAKALQDLGANLAQLSLKQLSQIPLPEALSEAIMQIKKITSHTARKRHLQFIGKIMRHIEDIAPIQEAYDNITTGIGQNTAQHHLIESWRSRLLSDDKTALTEFIQQYPCDKTQQLRLLIRKAKSERDRQKNLGASKALFQLIKTIIS